VTKQLLAVALAALPALALATDVNVIGLFPGKAVVVINRGAPQTLSVGGAPADGVRLLSVDRSSATLEFDGKREKLEMGQHYETAAVSGRARASRFPPTPAASS